MKSLKHLKAGDKVVRHYRKRRTIRTVDKITPSGLIKVGDELFYLNGTMRGSTLLGPTIEAATVETEQEITDNNVISMTLGYMRQVETITADQARRIAAILTEEQ